MSRLRLSRRTLLRGVLGAGTVALGLPALEAMIAGNARGDGSAPPLRLITVFFKNGVAMDQWTPSKAGSSFTLPRCLTPLEPHQAALNVITGLFNPGATAGPGGDHIRGTGSFATGMPITGTGAGGPSIDQLAASELGSATRLPSLVIAPEGHPGGGDSDGASDACNHLSWSGANTPVPPQVDPRALFDKLFDGAGDLDADAMDALRARRASVLDSVGEDVKRLQQRLGASDRRRLDAHLSALRELEQQAETAPGCVPPEAPDAWEKLAVSQPAPEAKIKLMMDLMVQAMSCDITRFASFSLALDVAPRLLELFGETRDHHTISHDNSESVKPVIEEYSRHHVELFAYLLERMKDVSEGEGTLLDNSAVFFVNQVAHGDLHTHDNLPVIVAGSAGGQFRTGRHVHLLGGDPEPGRRDSTLTVGRSVNDLFLTLLGAVGVPSLESFGLDGSKALDLG
jgi:hypothetical protein